MQSDKALECSATEGWKTGMTLPSRGKPLKWKAEKLQPADAAKFC